MKATRMSVDSKVPLQIGLSLLLAASAWSCAVEPEPTGMQEQESIVPIIIPKMCDNVFSNAPCKNMVAGAACAPPQGGQCTPVAPIGNGSYNCLSALPPPPADASVPPADASVAPADARVPPADAYEGPLSLISIGNGRRTGGFFMTPHADPFDGKLTLAFGYRPTRRGLFRALPRAFKAGKGSYVEMQGMYEVNCTHISIHLDKPSPAHTDGELLPQWVQDFEYQIQPKRIHVIVP